jgi:hypothetical protein
MTLEQALERIAELEALLEHAIWIKEDETGLVMHHLGLTETEAGIVVALYKANGDGLKHSDLDVIVPGRPGMRYDPEFRNSNVMACMLSRVRGKLPGVVSQTSARHLSRTTLTEEGRRIVGEALGE